MKIVRYILVFIVFPSLVFAQLPQNQRSTKDTRTSMMTNSALSRVKAENIGPTIMNGRVTDIDVNPADPTEFFVAYATGGLWHTANNGTTFTPLFQNESVITIGDIAVDWPSGTVYIGSGEQNSSRSSYAGNGIYKSTDKGKTWTHLGLDETHHISKIIVDPTNANNVYVAALGHLYTSNEERGVFKTSDGGKTWVQALYVNVVCGASDIIIHPTNPQILYAAMWERSRTAWNFVESGESSGIYKTVDGGDTWTLLTEPNSGFVTGKGKGRIGLDMTIKDGIEYVYAVIDNNNRRPKKEDKTPKKELTKESLKTMSKQAFLALKEDDIKAYLSENDFPEKYSAKKVIELVTSDKTTVNDIATYNDDANSAMFDTPVIGAEVYVSTDKGTSWSKTHQGYLDDVYYSYGYYFGQIRVQAGDPNKVYIFGVPIIKSNDGGKTWEDINSDNVHSDHHALWLSPTKPGHLINGNDGGVNISYDDGQSWLKCTHPEVGQFYYINADQAEPYNVYVGAQDNGVWMGAHNYKRNTRWQSSGQYPYKSIMGGDGMQVQIDNRDNKTVYTGFQFGNYFRLNNNKRQYITPKHDLGQKPYRWNWQTPILLSTHNQDILYMGANKVLRSMNQGTDFTEISGDLTKGGKAGNVPFGTLTTIHESSLKFGLIYAGSDDGLVHVTKDGGVTWTLISDNLPQDLWVSRVQASAFDEATVYLTLNGYRNDNFRPYVFVSNDFGDTWSDISLGLPNEPVNVIKEDPADGDILYVGTDHGTYVSLDKGKSYMPIAIDIPNVPVHDLVIQAKSKHLLLGTHGRSIYKMDIANLQKLKGKLSESVVLFGVKDMKYSSNWGKIRNQFSKPNTPTLTYELYTNAYKSVTVELQDANGLVLHKESVEALMGLSTYELAVEISPNAENSYLKSVETSKYVSENGPLSKADNGKYYPIPGEYNIVITEGKNVVKTPLKIKE